ncbi:unnamed protein product [Plutella xylostella]|uniref:(diamondback moth) hypothetical protein n=1 Tax=Plutella xylostella TaxID=51655 RepID=A0A8S4G4Z7_PLUXY|nr:unnamed protein product [Plutella xylostella]
MNVKEVNIALNVGDQLTSTSCGHVVVELIKFIAYQRLQIPYTYQWLKQIVNKKILSEDCSVKGNLQSERHFRIVSTALHNLDSMLKSLLQEISGASMPQEVCITLGATPVTCKEVYRFILPTLCHKPQCQSELILKDNKLQTSVFRRLVTSEDLSQAFSSPLPPTNMHVFLKKKLIRQQTELIVNSDNFLPASGSRIPKSSRVFVIDFRAQNEENVSCCNEFAIFGDGLSDAMAKMQVTGNTDDAEFCKIQSTDEVKWYQSTYVMKGFKDCIINGSSVTNTWIES